MHRAFERLAQAIDQAYEDADRPYLDRPWTLRDRYIHVMLGESSAAEVVNELAGRSLPADVIYRMQWLLEAQRECHCMFTSCG